MSLLGRLTAIEFGADTCVLVKTGMQGGRLRVSAVDAMDPAAFPGTEAFAQALRETRKRLRMPRRARVVLWGTPEGAATADSVTDPLIRPLPAAGFHVERIVSPCDALAALARARTPRGDAPVLWLAINRGGIALIVIQPGELLYARSFLWDSSIGSSGSSQARLLQRYTQVAFVAPEVRQAIAAVAQRGARVETVVTCGNLPDLRSLTMPLIEELDVEVETLDSFDGLVMAPELMDQHSEIAAAVRLACAGAFARPVRPRRDARSGWSAGALFRAAVLAIAALGIAWLWIGSRRPSGPAPVPVAARPATPSNARVTTGRAPVTTPVQPRPQSPSRPAPALSSPAPALKPPAEQPRPQVVAKAAPVSPTVVPAPKPPMAQPRPQGAAKAVPVSPTVVPAPKPPMAQPLPQAAKPPASTTPVPSTSTIAKPSTSPGRPAPTQGPPPKAVAPIPQPAPARPPVTSTAAVKPPRANPPVSTPSAPAPHSSIAAPPRTQPPPPPAAKPPVTRPSPPLAKVEPPPPARPRVEPHPATGGPALLPKQPSSADKARGAAQPRALPDPLPHITTILSSDDRRLAMLDDGTVLTVGDMVGHRVVTAIEPRQLVLREPSGLEVRVGLGGRLIGVGRFNR